MKNKKVKICVAALSIMGCIGLNAQSQKQTDNTVNGDKAIDEVIWVVGDEAILKSDVEAMRAQSESENIKFKGNPDCAIPEQLAVQKLFLHQAAIDSLQVTESEINNGIEEQINYWIQLIGSREKLEEYKKQTISQMRNQMYLPPYMVRILCRPLIAKKAPKWRSEKIKKTPKGV